MPPFVEKEKLPTVTASEVATELTESDVNQPNMERPKMEILWKRVLIATCVHLFGIYGVYLFFFKTLWLTNLFTCFLIVFSLLGITGGAHRLWTHRTYKARLPLQILLLIMNTIAFQEAVISWARDHRLHHKYSDSDADPYNAKRGLFFSHMGWLFVRRHPDIKNKLKTIDLSDLTSDPLLIFQKRYYLSIGVLIAFGIPACVPILWGESLWNGFFVCAAFRYVYSLHVTWLVNSAAHAWGYKPYDKNIYPVENKIIAWFTFGEGFHNFHHTFPWDYKTGELGGYYLNTTKLFIDFMAAIGWAYDLKYVSDDIVKNRIQRTGDGSY